MFVPWHDPDDALLDHWRHGSALREFHGSVGHEVELSDEEKQKSVSIRPIGFARKLPAQPVQTPDFLLI